MIIGFKFSKKICDFSLCGYQDILELQFLSYLLKGAHNLLENAAIIVLGIPLCSVPSSFNLAVKSKRNSPKTISLSNVLSHLPKSTPGHKKN